MVNGHYCDLHQSKFYKNEKEINGQTKVWYSHKMLDGRGFCVERDDVVRKDQLAIPFERTKKESSAPSQYMLMCNAMNNAIALAANDKIKLDQIGSYYQKILNEFMNTASN